MTIVQLFGERQVDGIIDCEPMPGVRFHIAFVVGIGNCPHQHRLREKAERCKDRMRAYIEYSEVRAHPPRVTVNGKEMVVVHRWTRSGPRPTRRPW